MKYLFLVGFLFNFLLLQAQEERSSDSIVRKENKAIIFYGESEQISKPSYSISADKPVKKGKIELLEEEKLDLLIEGYKGQKEIEGYKIQLFSGRSRMEAVKMKSSFHNKYGESESAELLYQQPNFKIRVGNYRDRLDAHKWLAIYKVDFPSSFIVKDVININQKK